MEYILPTIVAIFGVIFLFVKYNGWKTSRDERKNGYRIEYVSPGILRAGEHEFALIYHQDGRQITFIGKESDEQNTLDPGMAQGSPEDIIFYQTNRDLVISRLREEVSTKRMYARISLVDEPETLT